MCGIAAVQPVLAISLAGCIPQAELLNVAKNLGHWWVLQAASWQNKLPCYKPNLQRDLGMFSEGWMDLFFPCVFSETPLLLVKSTQCMSFDAFCLIVMEFRDHRCFGIFSFIFLCCLECLCSRLQSEIADGFKMKCMQQTCQCEKNDVWERIRDHGYKRAALWQVIFFVTREEMKGNENIYGVVQCWLVTTLHVTAFFSLAMSSL